MFVMPVYGQVGQGDTYYARFGLGVSADRYLKGKTTYTEEDVPVTYEFNPFTSVSFYVSYRLFGAKKHQFWVGAKLSMYYTDETIYVTPGQYIDNPRLGTELRAITRGDDDIVSLSLTYKYFFNIKQVRFNAFVSALPGYEDNWGGETEFGRYNIDVYNKELNRHNDQFRFNIEVGIGLYIKTKFFIIEPQILFNKSFTDIWITELHVTGIQNRPYTSYRGSIRQSGDYYAFGLNFIPKKFW